MDNVGWFAQRKIPVLPLNGKTGDVKKAKVTTDIKGNYGVALGNGLIGIDFDEHDGASGIALFKDTRYWKSGSNQGYGILYYVPKELSEHGFSLGDGITVRACGSYLVGPDSIHPGTPKKDIKPGGIYTLVNDVEIQDAPEWLQGFCKARLASINETELVLGFDVQPEWLHKDKKFVKKFETADLSDRSGKTYEIAAYSAERGATNEELSWIISNFRPAIDKGYLSSEVPRVIRKVRNLHQHSGSPCDQAQCGNTPAWMQKEAKSNDEIFWNYRPELKYIHDSAKARMVSPQAVLGSVLAHVSAALPPEVVLPATIGKEASLNLFVCFVGQSGAGKGNATKVAADLFDYTSTGFKYVEEIPGSGEGIVDIYAGWDVEKKAFAQHTKNALLNIDEIDNLAATGNRSGSTLIPVLRSAFSGEKLGWHYKKNPTQLNPHSYRMCLQVSAQPLRSDWLLDDVDGGLPQRFVFVSCNDPDCADPNNLPELPKPLAWKVPDEILNIKKKQAELLQKNKEEKAGIFGQLAGEVLYESKFIQVTLCQKAQDTIRAAAYNRLRGNSEAIDGHLLLVRTKVAALLAILNGRLNVDDKDWELSSLVMSWSKKTLNYIISQRESKNQSAVTARTTARANQEVVIENTKRSSDLVRVANRIIALVDKGVVETKGRGQLGYRLARDRPLMGEAIEYLIEQKKVTYDEDKDLLASVK
jgi:hypothetical protein